MHNLTALVEPKTKEELESLLEQLLAVGSTTEEGEVPQVPQVPQPAVVPQVVTTAPTPVSPTGVPVVAPPPVTSGEGGS